MVSLIASSEDTKVYEVAVLYPADLGDKADAQLSKDIDAIFAESNAKLVFKDVWGKRGLAYSVKGHTEGKFIIYYYEIDPANIRTIDQALRLEKNVLRHMLLVPPKGYEAVSFAANYDNWIKNRETVEDMRNRKKDEQTQEKIQARAKVEARRAEAKKKDKKPSAPLEAGKITAELDKLISDGDLNI